MRDLTITSLDTMTVFDLTTDKNLLAVLDELQNATLSNTEDSVDITGKQGRKISTIKRNKAATITGTNGLISGGLLAAQLGSTVSNGSQNVLVAEEVTFATNTASVTHAPAANTKAFARVAESNGALGEMVPVTIGSTASSGKYTVTGPTSGSLSGKAVVYFFTTNANVDKIVNESGKYSEKCEIYVDGTAEDPCGSVYKIQIHFPKAVFDGNFDLEFGENQSVHNFTAQALAGLCDKGQLWEMFIFTDNGVEAG